MSNKTPTLFDDFFAEEDNHPAPKAEPVKKKKNTKEKPEEASSLSLFLGEAGEDGQQAEAKDHPAGEQIPDQASLDEMSGDEACSVPEPEQPADPVVSESGRLQAESAMADASIEEELPDEDRKEIPDMDSESSSSGSDMTDTAPPSSERKQEEMHILDQTLRTELPYRFSFETEEPAGEPPKKKSAIVFENAPAPVEKKFAQAESARQETKPEESGIQENETSTDTLPDPATAELPQWNLDKKYYTISTVAKMFDVNISHIRFWTNEFNLRPRTNKKGDRLYTPELIETLRLIHHLVKVQHHTIKGAKAKLKTKKAAVDAGITLKENLIQLKETLLELRNQIN